jgi:outer membrane immunogenic protein
MVGGELSMKAIALAACSALISTSVYAADLTAAAYEAAPVVADNYTWTGAYIGLNAGYGWGDFDHSVQAKGPEGKSPLPGTPESEIDYEILDQATYSSSPGGFVGGVQLGYNWQFAQFLVGVEADFQGANIKGSVSGGADPYGFNAESKIDWYGTARARVGYIPAERFLVYATGGLAYGHVESYMNYAGFESSVSTTKSGYTVGGGVEYAFHNNWSLKTEYLYTDLGKIDSLEGQRGYRKFSAETEASFQAIRIGLNYKF